MMILKNFVDCGLLTDATFSDKESALEKYLETFVKDILKTKDKKYYRDRLAYETNTAYHWSENRKRRNRPFPPKNYNSNQDPTDSNESSLSSLSSSEAGSTRHSASGSQKCKTDHPASNVSASKRTPRDLSRSGLHSQPKSTHPLPYSANSGDGHSISSVSTLNSLAASKVSQTICNTVSGDLPVIPNPGDLRTATQLTPNLKKILNTLIVKTASKTASK